MSRFLIHTTHNTYKYPHLCVLGGTPNNKLHSSHWAWNFFFLGGEGEGVPMCLHQISTNDLSLYSKKKVFPVTLIFTYLLNKVELLFMFIDYFPWWVTADVLHHFVLTGFLFTGVRDICKLEEIGQVAIYDTHIQLSYIYSLTAKCQAPSAIHHKYQNH